MLWEGQAAGHRRGALDGCPGVTCFHPLVHVPPLLGQDQCVALLRASPPAQVPVATEGLRTQDPELESGRSRAGAAARSPALCRIFQKLSRLPGAVLSGDLHWQLWHMMCCKSV